MLKRVLMCQPTYFRVEYTINPWMKPGTVDPKKAQRQWEALVSSYLMQGMEVEILDQNKDLPDMVFAADQGIFAPDGRLIMSSFKYPERQGESKEYAKWFKSYGIELEILPKEINFEGGGECLPWNGKYFVGQGLRNSKTAQEYINQNYGVEFIPLDLINPKYYHLDTCFFLLNSRTAFYYPPAFSQESIDNLKSLIPNLIEFTDDEIQGFCANSVVSGQNVFIQRGNPSFYYKLRDMDYNVIELDVSEFIKAGGGIHCLTFELERMPYLEIIFDKQTINQSQLINQNSYKPITN